VSDSERAKADHEVSLRKSRCLPSVKGVRITNPVDVNNFSEVGIGCRFRSAFLLGLVAVYTHGVRYRMMTTPEPPLPAVPF
jgi:hypothetical protein